MYHSEHSKSHEYINNLMGLYYIQTLPYLCSVLLFHSSNFLVVSFVSINFRNLRVLSLHWKPSKSLYFSSCTYANDCYFYFYMITANTLQVFIQEDKLSALLFGELNSDWSSLLKWRPAQCWLTDQQTQHYKTQWRSYILFIVETVCFFGLTECDTRLKSNCHNCHQAYNTVLDWFDQRNLVVL